MVKNKKTKVVIQAKPAKKKKPRVTNREIGILGNAFRGLGSYLGGAAGAPFGMAAQASGVGHSLGAQLSRWLGAGDYSVTSNSIVQKASNSVPMMHKTDQKITVRHKEFLCEVRSSIDFSVLRTFAINPGLVQTFPWMARIAANFQTYSIKGMVYHYVPTSGSAIASTNNALGSVMLQTSYRSNESPPANKIELLNEYWSSEAVPSEAFCHPVECNPKENPFQVQYVRSGPVPVGDNQLLYDLGSTYLAVSGQQANGIVLGDLWVTYEIELSKPILSSNVTNDDFLYGFTSQENPDFVGNNYIGTHNVLGSFPIPPTTIGRTLTMPVGTFGVFQVVIAFTTTGGVAGFNMFGAPVVTNCVLVSAFRAPISVARAELFSVGAGANSTISYVCAFQKSNPEVVATIQFPGAGPGSGTINRCSMSIEGSSDLGGL